MLGTERRATGKRAVREINRKGGGRCGRRQIRGVLATRSKEYDEQESKVGIYAE